MIKRRVQIGANGMLTEYADPALETTPSNLWRPRAIDRRARGGWLRPINAGPVTARRPRGDGVKSLGRFKLRPLWREIFVSPKS